LIVRLAGGAEVRVAQVPPGMEDRVANELERLLGEKVTVSRPVVGEEKK